MIDFASTLRRMKIAAIVAGAALMTSVAVAPGSSAATPSAHHAPTVRQIATRIAAYHIPASQGLRVIESSCDASVPPLVWFLDVSNDLAPMNLPHQGHRAAELYVHLGRHHIGLHIARLSVATGPAGSTSLVLHTLFSAKYRCAA